MVKWEVIFSRQSQKDAKKIKAASLENRVQKLIDTLTLNPFQNPPPYERLVGNLNGFYSRRINIQHRLVYSVQKENKTVHILTMWTHYE